MRDYLNIKFKEINNNCRGLDSGNGILFQKKLITYFFMEIKQCVFKFAVTLCVNKAILA